MARAKRSHSGPESGTASRRTAKDRGNAIRRRALALIPAEGRASTRGRRVHRVSAASPRTKMKRIERGDSLESTT